MFIYFVFEREARSAVGGVVFFKQGWLLGSIWPPDSSRRKLQSGADTGQSSIRVAIGGIRSRVDVNGMFEIVECGRI